MKEPKDYPNLSTDTFMTHELRRRHSDKTLPTSTDDFESKASRRWQMFVIYSSSALISVGWSVLCFWLGYWMAGG